MNKDGGNNYASCDGVYTRNTDVYINNEHPYVNEERQRFIGRTGKGWTLTGKQWFDAIVEESKDKHHIFGGFHGSEGESEVVALSKWKEYEVIVCNGENYDYENYDYDKYVVGEISDEDEDEEEEEEEEEKEEEKEEDEEQQGMMLEVEEKDET